MKTETTTKTSTKTETPLFTIRPNVTVAIIPLVIAALFAGAFIGGFLGIITKSIALGLVVGVIAASGAIFLRLMNLNATRYVFFASKAEFYEGFLAISQRNVRYEKITDYVLHKSIWDRMFGTGTIKLVTAGHEGAPMYYGGYAAAMGGGLVLRFVEQPDEVFAKIEELVGKR
jgi:hypothetical protein